jgi:hypothetical protein
MRKRRIVRRARARKKVRGGGTIAHVIGAWITHYGDSGQVTARVRWQRADGSEGETEGSPNNPHMQALLDRAIRSGVRIKNQTFGSVYGPSGSWVTPPNESVPARFR